MIRIGLEIHCQLTSLKTKLFCGCSADYRGKPPNTHVCPVCLGLPGAMPVINKKAVEMALMVALALNCKIAKTTFFARKNYFYPDLPKNFQISQYDLEGGEPLASNGYVTFTVNKTRKVRVTVDGELAPWIELSESDFTLHPGESKEIKVWIYVPEDAELERIAELINLSAEIITNASSGFRAKLLDTLVTTRLIREFRPPEKVHER